MHHDRQSRIRKSTTHKRATQMMMMMMMTTMGHKPTTTTSKRRTQTQLYSQWRPSHWKNYEREPDAHQAAIGSDPHISSKNRMTKARILLEESMRYNNWTRI